MNRSKIAEDFIFSATGNKFEIFEYDNHSYLIPDLSLIKRKINFVSLGVLVGENLKSRFEPHHNLFTTLGNSFKLKLNYDYNSKEIQNYLKGETLSVDLNDGYGVIYASNCSLGGFKISQGKFKNLYPKGLRNFK